MPSIRRRKQFKAVVRSPQGQPVTDCFAIVDIETTVNGDSRHHTWRGKLSSLSAPEKRLQGRYLLQPAGSDQTTEIELVPGDWEPAGLTSDEYDFVGLSAPPDVKSARS